MLPAEHAAVKTSLFELLTKNLFKFCALEIFDAKLDEFIGHALQHIVIKLGQLDIAKEGIDLGAFKAALEKINEAILSNVSLVAKLSEQN